jgi:hypothetical protein
MVMRESALSYRAAEETLPLRDAFAVQRERRASPDARRQPPQRR